MELTFTIDEKCDCCKDWLEEVLKLMSGMAKWYSPYWDNPMMERKHIVISPDINAFGVRTGFHVTVMYDGATL